MTIKTTLASVERDLGYSLTGFRDRAHEVTRAYPVARQQILDDPMISDLAKKEKLAELNKQTRDQLVGIRAEQDAYVQGLRDKIERQLRGNQPTDANSVMLRRDAADRARRITDQQEAVDALNDAIANGDEVMAHALGNRGRNTGMTGVVDTWQAAFPETAESATALAYVEANTSGAAYNVANSIAYSDPTN